MMSCGGMGGPYPPPARACALSGSSPCIHDLMIDRLGELSARLFWSQTTSMPAVLSDDSCDSVGPSHNPTYVLIPRFLNAWALPGLWSQTASGKKFSSAGNELGQPA